MEPNKFKSAGTYPNNPKWENLIQRNCKLYQRSEDIRSDFTRDYNRILHCNAYRRLKHKTQVFFATKNDHICTRIEHVNHVSSVSYTISNFLGLNTELTSAIAIGHDIGHAPFGHQGEKILNEIVNRELKNTFWHESNSLWFADNIETLPNPEGKQENLELTYAVRDGIILHCGEMDDNAIFPRDTIVDLTCLNKAGQISPYTWEGCVVKISDKISYLGRDIEDAIIHKMLLPSQIRKLRNILRQTIRTDLGLRDINNTVLMHKFIINLCEQSNPNAGLCFSEEYLQLMKSIKDFNYEYIYNHPRLNNFKNYVKLIINSIFNTLNELYDGINTLESLERHKEVYPLLINTFTDWLIKYSDINDKLKRYNKYNNKTVYFLEKEEDYIKSIIHFISGMTDNFAIKIFDELTSF